MVLKQYVHLLTRSNINPLIWSSSHFAHTTQTLAIGEFVILEWRLQYGKTGPHVTAHTSFWFHSEYRNLTVD